MANLNPMPSLSLPEGVTALLVLADGSILPGHGFGATGATVGEVCFNTAMTGYQEILTDPSYAGQIITFTFPHIGNVGTNAEDVESETPPARGLIIRESVTEPSNYRALEHLHDWTKARNLIGISGIDTRALTRKIRDQGFLTGVIAHHPEGQFDLEDLQAMAASWPGLEGMDLAKDCSRTQLDHWQQTLWRAGGAGFGQQEAAQCHIVALDFGAKHNILRALAETGCKVTVLPAQSTAEEVLSHHPDGVFLSNGPGDPAATGAYAVPTIQGLLEAKIPLFGICLGHQMLALALGGQTEKMHHGHRGANHPVKDLATGQVEITSMNHGFVVAADSLPEDVDISHVSLFDGTVAGLKLRDRPVFSVQHHPEASPGPHDAHHLFQRFVDMVHNHKKAS